MVILNKVSSKLTILLAVVLAVVVGVVGQSLWSAKPWLRLARGGCYLEAGTFLKPGIRREFSLKYDSAADSSLGALLSGGGASAPLLQQAFKVSLQAQWAMTLLSDSGSEYLIANELVDPRLTLLVDGVDDPERDRNLAAPLSRVFYFVLNTRGEVISLKADPGLTSIQRNLLRWLVARTQLNLPENPNRPASNWMAAGNDPNGRFEASYALEPQEHGVRITQRKLRYLELVSSPQRKKRIPGRLSVDVAMEPSGTAVGDYDCTRGGLARLSVAEQSKTRIGDTRIASADDHFELLYKSESPAAAERVSALLADYQAPASASSSFGLAARESAEEIQRRIQVTELGDLTQARLLGMLAQAKKSGDPKAIDRLYLKFKALVYLHPESCARLGEILQSEDPRSKTMMMLATALSAVGSPAAQKALVTALSLRSDDIVAVNALVPALGMTDHPTLESEQALRDLIASSKKEEIVTTAGLSLGAMAGHLAESEPDRQKQIVESVARDYDRAESTAQKKFLVSILGNAGSADSLALVEGALSSPEPAMQSEAAMALRFVPGSEAENRLVGVLAEAQSDSVREAAAVALDFRDPSLSLSERMRSAFASEKSEGVRRQLVKSIYDAHQVDPAVRDWLGTVKENDPSQDVRKSAAGFYSLLAP